MWDNGVAGIRISGSNNFTFEATFADYSSEGAGFVGSTDDQQPIEVIVESSSLVTFHNMSVRSTNGETHERLRCRDISPTETTACIVSFGFRQEMSYYEHDYCRALATPYLSMQLFSYSSKDGPQVILLKPTVLSLPRGLLFTDPVMTVSADSSGVVFDSCGFSRVDSGTCVIEVQGGTRGLFPVHGHMQSLETSGAFVLNKESLPLNLYYKT